VGKVVQHLQSVNYDDSCAHGCEQHGHFKHLDGFGWFGYVRFVSSWFGLWYAASAMVLGLATCEMPMSVGRFWLHV
jgi:hypothetical protein